MGPSRRQTTDVPFRTGGKSYSEIREAYNIPSNNTLPPGVSVSGNTSNESGMDRNNNNNGNNKNPTHPNNQNHNNNANNNNGQRSFNGGVSERTSRNRNPMAGGVGGKRRITLDGSTPPPTGLQRGGGGGGMGGGGGGLGVSNRQRHSKSPAHRRNSATSDPGPPASDGNNNGSHDSNGGNGNSNSLNNGRPRLSGRGLAGLKPLPEHQSFRGSMPSHDVNNMGIEELMGEDYFQLQKDLNKMNVGKLKTELKLMNMPVDGIYDKQELIRMFSRLNPFDLQRFVEKCRQKDLNLMSVKELKAEAKEHGVMVDGGSYERMDLIAMCDRKRKEKQPTLAAARRATVERRGSIETHISNSGKSHNSGVSSNTSSEIGISARSAPVRGRRRGEKPPDGVAKHRRRASVDSRSRGVSNSQRRRKTIDEANPQQGMSYFTQNIKDKGPGGYNSFTEPTITNISFTAPSAKSNSFTAASTVPRRTSSNLSNLSSNMGDNADNNNNNNNNAKFALDNQSVGQVIKQMHQLERQQAPAAQAQDPRPQPPPAPPQKHPWPVQRAPAGRRRETVALENSAPPLVDARNHKPPAQAMQRDNGGNSGHPRGQAMQRDNGGNNGRPQGQAMQRDNSGNNARGEAFDPNSAPDMPPLFRTGSEDKSPIKKDHKKDIKKVIKKDIKKGGGMNSFRLGASDPPTAAGSTLGSEPMDFGESQPDLETSNLTSAGRQLTIKKKRKKRLICALVVVLLGSVTALAVTLGISMGGRGDKDGNGDPLSKRDVVGADSPPTASPARPPPERPPPDIEGRCSPSNLPGSLSACRVACLPAACCYPGGENETCVDDPACGPYRPYCDVIHDPWPGAEDGTLRRPPEDVVESCAAGREVDGLRRARLRRHVARSHDDDDEGSRRRLQAAAPASDACDRLCQSARCCRAPSPREGLSLSYGGVYTDPATNQHVVTNCQFGENKELCNEYAKFCAAYPFGARPASNASVALARNATDAPTAPEAPAISPSPANPPSPPSNSSDAALKSPSDYSTPTAIPPAETFEIAAACSGDVNTAMISSGVHTARVKCISACQTGLCCFADQLGYDSDEVPLCYEGNAEVCVEYLPCLVLAQGNGNIASDPIASTSSVTDAENIPNEYDATPDEMGNMTGAGTIPNEYNDIPDETNDSMTSTGNIPNEYIDIPDEMNPAVYDDATENTIEAPPTPPQDIALTCAQDSVVSISGLISCLGACEAGSCCFAQEADDEPSCHAEHPAVCAMYQPCTIISIATQEDEESPDSSSPAGEGAPQVGDPPEQEPPQLPPRAPMNLPTVCSYESLATSGQECYDLCLPTKCCSDRSCLASDEEVSQATLDELGDICETYQPCYNLFLVSTLPSNINETCNGDDTSAANECSAICSTVSCCFSDSNESPQLSSSTRLIPAVRQAVCPGAYDPAAVLSYREGSEVSFIGLVYRCNGAPWAFYCSRPDFAPFGDNGMWRDAWKEVGPCIQAPTEQSLPSPPPTRSPVTAIPTYSPVAESNELTTSSNESTASCYEHFEETCNQYAPYCAPAVELPPPPSDLAILCDLSASYCEELCKAASCCFESSSELNCFNDNKEHCEGYIPCLTP